MNKIILLLSFLSFSACSQQADAQMTGVTAGEGAERSVSTVGNEEKVYNYTSPNGLNESCIVLKKLPGGDYSKKDREQEAKLCSVDMYAEQDVAMCPKTWSTSPATMVLDISETTYSNSSYQSSEYCGKRNKARAEGVSTIAKFKNTMNQSGTSGTFSHASLLYYHFSRLLDTKVNIPVSVYREIDKATLAKVAKIGDRRTSKGQINAGWDWMVKTARDPRNYRPTSEVATDDLTRIYGILIRGKGARYSPIINGTRPRWGLGDAKAFKNTPAYYALRQPDPLPRAIEKGIAKANTVSVMRPDIKGGISELQMLFWMRELIEVSLLDYIFSQQDRVGNIDYDWYWYYVKDGKVKRQKEKRDEFKKEKRSNMKKIPVPSELTAYRPVLIQRTNINDNDAGGRVAYANWAKEKKADWLTPQRHYSAKIFKNLMALNADLQSGGQIYQWLNNNIKLSDRQVKQVVTNTRLAAENISSRCESLIFDLDDVDNFQVKGYRTESVDCTKYKLK